MMRSVGDNQSFDVFDFQCRALPVLMGWAAGSLVAGWLWWRSHSTWWRGLGTQFAGGGLIDGGIAGFGLRGALRNSHRLASGQIDQGELKRQARNFERLLWINTGLDVGYVVAGLWLARHYPDDEGRRAMGWGIILQGAFLLVYDLILARLVRARRDAA